MCTIEKKKDREDSFFFLENLEKSDWKAEKYVERVCDKRRVIEVE